MAGKDMVAALILRLLTDTGQVEETEFGRYNDHAVCFDEAMAWQDVPDIKAECRTLEKNASGELVIAPHKAGGVVGYIYGYGTRQPDIIWRYEGLGE